MTKEKQQKKIIRKTKARILLVDDEENILEVMKIRLELLGYEVIATQDPEEALEIFSENPDIEILLTDQRMENLSGQELMSKCLEINPYLQTIIFTAFGTIEQAVEAMRAGAFSYVTKPVDHKELEVKLEQALEKTSLLKKVHDFEGLIDGKSEFCGIIGKSPKMKSVFKQILQVAPTDITVAVFGESGTGKELVARAIHMHSGRAKGPFIAVNCAAIPESLLEDELFGHVRGAFTSAVGSKNGVFASADTGTLFLDEVGEMAESMQAKLLRVLETGEVKPLGSDRVRKVDVRLIVATKQDLKKMVAEGKFREDLFYRIHVVPIHMPPLRERKQDIPLLFGHFLKKAMQKTKKLINWVDEDILDAFRMYDWPGNVRELENMVDFLVAIAQEDILSSSLLAATPLAEYTSKIPVVPLKEARYEFTRKYLENLLKITKGNISLAAKHAGYYRADFYKLLERHELEAESFRKKPRKISTSELSNL
ncbi:MAG: sigma-54-dependent Fis family transcriptional regulator [Thermodesulfobacteria bacterium]|nr:sigma-54-dependent Fis family transcriptional regulator [Thermodesulfobacteriota bacterium]